MRSLYVIILFISICTVQKAHIGTYSYHALDYSESIEIKENNKFVYKLNFNSSQYEVKGRYLILNDSLILNSYPQKDRMIVFEDNKGKKKNLTFKVKTKYGNYFTYDLHVILANNEERIFKNQWHTSKLNNLNIKGFYIIDKNGLQSPKYSIMGTATNYFEIFFETSRIFENESWVIKDNKIIPRSFNGELQQYFLTKN